MDKFYEQHLGTEKNSLYVVFNVLIYAFGFISSIALLFTLFTFNIKFFIGFILLSIITYLMLYMRNRQYTEYEYIFTNGNLQIDAIYNKQKRKTLLDIDVKEFEAFGKESEIKVLDRTKKNLFIPWNCNEDRYVFLYNKQGKKAGYIAPDEEMLKLINLYNRGKRI
ncbi:DUF6106 family protein [Caloramator sp. ALD01]|uniref:DUF6106 family protein n=1 Tax=Caloramator sp. ALD01 TaxID=1031288 RepID=UPI00041025FB|nr:DUF6106 family protein [Caloramator sp. ALD01]